MPEEEQKVDLFLDSGAFSANSQGVEIDIDEYISFIKKHRDVITAYANLDVIDSAEDTWKNQKKMEGAGLEPIPVFHYGEDVSYLEAYIDAGCEYIGVGGMVPIPNMQLTHWLDELFDKHLTDTDGYPRVKVHGFGLTSLRLMQRYPWYSVDSTSWVVTGRMGSVYVPRYRGGKWLYDENSWKIAVSSRSPETKEAGKHFFTLSPMRQQLVLDYLNEIGYSMGKSAFVEVPKSYKPKEGERWADKESDRDGKRLLERVEEWGVSNDYRQRDEVNIRYFIDLEARMPEWPWPFKKTAKQKSFDI